MNAPLGVRAVGVRVYPTLRKTGRFAYTRMRAITWSSTGLIYFNQIQARSGRALADMLVAQIASEPVYVNCRGVHKADDYALEPIGEVIKEGRFTFILGGVSSALEQDIQRMLPAPNRKTDDGESSILAWGPEAGRVNLKAIATVEAPKLEMDAAERWIREAFVPFQDGKLHRLSSTPILASGVFNAQLLVADPIRFSWLCLLMAERLERELWNSQLTNPRLLSASLRASPFAAAVSELMEPKMDVAVVDHLGPKREIVEHDLVDFEDERVDYIYFADFILIGTELKLAQSYAHSRGARLKYAAAIGCLFDAKIYGSDLCVTSLTNLASCAKQAKYRVLG